MEQWRTMPWSWLVSVAPAGCGVVSIFWARWREPYRESVGVHWKRASSPSKKSNCRVRSGLEICTGGKKKSVPCHKSSRSKSSAAPQWLWEYKYTDTAWDFLSVKKKKKSSVIVSHLSAVILIMRLPPRQYWYSSVIPIPTVAFFDRQLSNTSLGPVTGAVTTRPVDRGLSSTVNQGKGKEQATCILSVFPYKTQDIFDGKFVLIPIKMTQ